MGRYISIQVIGYGEELVQGTFTDKEIEILENEMEKRDETLGTIMSYDVNSILPEKFDWYECDDITHIYGASVYSSNIKIVDGDKEIVLDNVWDLEDEPHLGVVVSEEFDSYDPDNNIITSISYEKGWIMYGGWELEDDEELDIKKLKIKIKDILFKNFEESLITDIIYDGKEIMWDSDTTGKSFDSFLVKKEKDERRSTV
jgi:hypothetical protein